MLKNEDNLSEEQLNKLIQVKSVSPMLKVMYELKEKFRKIFNNTNDWYAGVFKLGWGNSAIKVDEAKVRFSTSAAPSFAFMHPDISNHDQQQ
ncbi:transposase [Nostoc sp. CALU 546]